MVVTTPPIEGTRQTQPMGGAGQAADQTYGGGGAGGWRLAATHICDGFKQDIDFYKGSMANIP